MIASLLGLGQGVARVAEVFTENRTARGAQEHAEHLASLGQLGAEFARPRGGWFDDLVDGLNRLPRPALAMGTLGLFIYAMADPVSFGARMQGLALVPEPMWWLLGAIVSFYFGARELHHYRGRGPAPEAVAEVMRRTSDVRAIAAPVVTPVVAPQEDPQVGPQDGSDNAALAEWRGTAAG